MDNKILVGQVITRLEVKSSDAGLYLETDKGKFFLACVGDCCAQTWIEHFEAPKDIVGATILEMSTGPTTYDNEGDWEVVDKWVDKIVTSKGHVDMEMRCSHNGYYGGWLELTEVK